MHAATGSPIPSFITFWFWHQGVLPWVFMHDEPMIFKTSDHGWFLICRYETDQAYGPIYDFEQVVILNYHHLHTIAALRDTPDHSSCSIILRTSSITSQDLCPPITSACFWESLHSCIGQRTVLRIDSSGIETMDKGTSFSCTCIEGIFCSSPAVQIAQVGQKEALACVLI